MFAILGFLGPIGLQELLIILFVLLIFFGAKKLPELAKGLGQGIKEFKKATREMTEDEAPKIEQNNDKKETK